MAHFSFFKGHFNKMGFEVRNYQVRKYKEDKAYYNVTITTDLNQFRTLSLRTLLLLKKVRKKVRTWEFRTFSPFQF